MDKHKDLPSESLEIVGLSLHIRFHFFNHKLELQLKSQGRVVDDSGHGMRIKIRLLQLQVQPPSLPEEKEETRALHGELNIYRNLTVFSNPSINPQYHQAPR